jgi:hypothetical protein
MKFLNNKNNQSGIVFLILVLLLSQSNILNIMFNTTLGRLALVSLILTAGYLNKFMGIAAALVAVVMFNSFGNIYEGLEDGPKKALEDIDALAESALEKMKKKKETPTDTETIPETPTNSEGFIGTIEGVDILSMERKLQEGKHANAIGRTNSNSTKDVTSFDGTFNNFFSVF